MKLISIHSRQKVEDLLPQLKKQNRVAQKELFDRFSAKLLSTCRSYISDLQHAEDCMLKAFVKIFKNISSYKSEGSFEGWMRRIVVNECLDFLKSSKQFVYLEDSEWPEESGYEEDLSEIDVQELLDQLPESYRIVFNLYVLEDFSHKEISNQLNISESASKMQLSRAKSKMRLLLFELKNKKNELGN